AVVALMQVQSRLPVRTFTIGFHEKGFDEAGYARAVAAHLGTEHTDLYVNPADALRLIPQIPAWFDEPFADSSQLPAYLVYSMARGSVTVALSGDGGDELFAGYDRYSVTEGIWRIVRLLPLSYRSRLAVLLTVLRPEWLDGIASMLPTDRRPAQSGR